MHSDVVAALACPHDGGRLRQDGRVLGCDTGHRFDLARQGYATLIRRPLAHQGDPAPLVDRRSRVHAAGLLAPIHAAVVAAAHAAQDARAERLPAGIVCDVGAGPGTYLRAVLDTLPDRAGLAIEVSKAAARRAARCHERAGCVVADVWDALPVRAGAVALLLNVFAPRAPAEFARVLAPGGTLLIVTPRPGHLAQLREVFDLLEVGEDKTDQLNAQFDGRFEEVAQQQVDGTIEVTPAQAADLAGMGPSGHHLDEAALLQRASHLPDRTTVGLAVTVSRLVRRGGPGAVANLDADAGHVATDPSETPGE